MVPNNTGINLSLKTVVVGGHQNIFKMTLISTPAIEQTEHQNDGCNNCNLKAKERDGVRCM